MPSEGNVVIEIRYTIPRRHRRVFEFAYEEAVRSLRDRRRPPLCELRVSDSTQATTAYASSGGASRAETTGGMAISAGS
jgi:hypothetical protein